MRAELPRVLSLLTANLLDAVGHVFTRPVMRQVSVKGLDGLVNTINLSI